MSTQDVSIDAALETLRRAQFGVADLLRRAQGDAVGAFGLGPSECPYQVLACGPNWRLRAYANGAHAQEDSSHVLLIVAAPIKRPYIWDLSPAVSAVRYCLAHGMHVCLLEWLPATRDTSAHGIEESVLAISDCVARISTECHGVKPFLIGHSLGGTIAAIYAALQPESIQGLVLLGAPLCFQPGESQFREAIVAMAPPDFSDVEPFPGSLLSHMSALASPGTFIWSRLLDAAMSVSDPWAMDVHARVERWALDEVPLPGKLVHQIVDWLFRENRFCRGDLQIGDRLVGPSTLSIRTLAIVNTIDDVAPLTSLKPFIEAMPTKNTRILEYPGEVGVCLQHLGILVGRQAYAQVWPKIISWLQFDNSTQCAGSD